MDRSLHMSCFALFMPVYDILCGIFHQQKAFYIFYNKDKKNTQRSDDNNY